MEEFNFSTLTPIQQESPNMLGSMVTASPLIFPSQQPPGCELNSHLLVGGKETEDTTMYITVDTGPPSNIVPLLSNSPPAASHYSATAASMPTFLSPSIKSDDNNTTIASLIIGSDSTGGGFPNYLASTINESTRSSTVFVDNLCSLGTSTSNVVPTFSGMQFNRTDVDTSFGFSNISIPSGSETTSPSIFCGECSVNLPSSGDFFEHWVTHHCQLLRPLARIETLQKQDQQNNFIDATKISSDEMKNIIISSAVTNCPENTNNNSTLTDTAKGLIMEKCSVCNHIFVQGTERYSQHSRSGSCVSSLSNIATFEGRHNVDAVNNNDPSPGLRMMVPLNHNEYKIVETLETDVSHASNSQLSPPSDLPRIPLALSQVVATTLGNKKRKIGVVSPQALEDKNTIKRRETSPSSVVGTSYTKNCVCGVCNASVKTITSYFLHWLEHHQDDLNMKRKEMENSECTSLTNILQEVWQCRACPSNVTKLFPDCGMLSRHVESEHGGSTCQQRSNNYPRPLASNCQINFHNKESFDKHERQFHALNTSTEDLTNPNTSKMCPLCGEQEETLGSNIGISLCDHYQREHLVKCKVCQINLEVGEMETTHYLAEHKGEMVWNRRDRLKLITGDTVVRSKILVGAQKPTRLANGAIAKGIIGGVSLKPTSFSNSNNSATTHSAAILEGGNTTNDPQVDVSSKNLDLSSIYQVQVSPSISHHNLTSSVYQESACSPEKKRKTGEILIGHSTLTTTSAGSIASGNNYSGNATIVSSKIIPSSQDPQINKVFVNKSLMEKFVPITDGGSGSGGSLSYRCKKCRSVFNSNEKVMEKHYFANHEFRCKFCEQIMDKDVYGVHLRQHLATERRKANVSSLTTSSLTTNSSTSIENQDMNNKTT